MLKHWRVVVLWTVVVTFALWIRWWSSWDFALEHQIQSCDKTPDDCGSYNIIFFSAWRLAIGINYWSALVTAFATAAVAIFTGTIYAINKSQLAHSHQVERAYISIGGFPEVETIDRGTQTLPGAMGGGTTVHIGTYRRPTGSFQITLTNNGKTPGEILRLGFGFCETNEVPAVPQYNIRDFQKWIGPGTVDKLVYLIAIPKLKIPAIYARVFYRDIFGDKHSSGFIHSISNDSFSEPWPAPAAYTEERDEPQ